MISAGHAKEAVRQLVCELCWHRTEIGHTLNAGEDVLLGERRKAAAGHQLRPAPMAHALRENGRHPPPAAGPARRRRRLDRSSCACMPCSAWPSGGQPRESRGLMLEFASESRPRGAR
eukprot:SAG22_NODE_4_length_44774_cov_362.122149_32_plen_118_part_00